MTSTPRQTVSVPAAPDIEYEEIYVWPDEIKIGDIYGGYVVTGVHASEHYRSEARRLTVFTDPEALPDGVKPEEFGRMVIMTDRARGHKVPILRAVRD
jgi:hypothetical protein